MARDWKCVYGIHRRENQIKELKAQLEMIQSENAELKNQLTTMKTKLTRLTDIVEDFTLQVGDIEC